MKRCIIIPFIIIPLFLFSQNRNNFGYEDFKELFDKHNSLSDNLTVIPHNEFTEFLFDGQLNQIYRAIEMMSINDNLDFFVLNQKIVFSDEDEDDLINCEIYLIFKEKRLVGEYRYHDIAPVLELYSVSDGGTIDQSYKIQDDKSITIDYYHLDCCSSTGFQIPIETKTNINFYVSDQGELLVKDVLKWEIKSLFFNSNFQDSIAINQNLLYPTVGDSYNITISNNNVYIPITSNDIQISFYVDRKDGKYIPTMISRNKERQLLDSLIIERGMKETDRFKPNRPECHSNFYSHSLLMKVDDKQIKLSLDYYGHFVVEFNKSLSDFIE